MKSWIKRGIVPQDKQGLPKSATPKDHMFHGKLTNIWLGGLFNPAALLTAIKHEKAVLEETTHDQVSANGSVKHNIESIEELVCSPGQELKQFAEIFPKEYTKTLFEYNVTENFTIMVCFSKLYLCLC